jgi:hypothetical protein
MAEYISTIKYQDLVDIITQAKERLYFAAPFIDEETAHALAERHKQEASDVRVVIDLSEENIRNGYGDEKAIVLLKEEGVLIQQCKGLAISFIIADDGGYLLFPQSKVFASDASGPNAVRLDPLNVARIVGHFFQSKNIEPQDLAAIVLQQEQEVGEALQAIESGVSDVPVQSFDEEQFSRIQQNLEANPPSNPDLKREITVYSNKIQFVELRFDGAHIDTKKIDIPSNALPFRDAELKKKLETKMRLFENFPIDNAVDLFENRPLGADNPFLKFFQFREKVEECRQMFLVPVGKRDKAIIKTNQKRAFAETVDNLKKELDDLNKTLPEILSEEILNAKGRLRTALNEFMTQNPPEELSRYASGDTKKRAIADLVEGTVQRIRFPAAEKIVKKISLHAEYYDVPLEHFTNQEFLDELEAKEVMEKGDLESIVKIRKAYETKK